MDTYYPFIETPVTEQFRELVMSHYKFTPRNLPLIRMLDYILFQPWRDEETNLTILSNPVCKTFRTGQGRTNNFSAIKMIGRFRKELFDLALRGYSKDAGKARQIEYEFYPDWLIDGLRAMHKIDRSLRCVGFVSGSPVSLEDWEKKRRTHLLEGGTARTAIPQFILDYLWTATTMLDTHPLE